MCGKGELQAVEIFAKKTLFSKFFFFLSFSFFGDVFVTSNWHGQTFSNPRTSKIERKKNKGEGWWKREGKRKRWNRGNER